MDEFFGGLDGRLRASGMLADSIMMGIVNSAMENAYKNSCSKKGALVRLNEKSRFCELATMQLEWCLKFLQEEIEDNSIFESTCDREKLLSDLLVTRDRIHSRLKETELMIAEKDREFSERMEIESNLRLALEVKDEDITSLNTALGLEREKHRSSKKSMEKIGEVKSCIDEQLRRIKANLEDGQCNLKSLMQRMSSRSLDSDNLVSEPDVDGEEGSCSNSKNVNSKLMLERVQSFNLEIEFKEMAIGMDILKENIDSSFKTMASSVSLFMTMLDEQQWVWNAERDALNILIKGLLKEVQCGLNSDLSVMLEDVPHVPLDVNWVAFMDDIASLHTELQKLVPQMDMIKLVDKVNPEKEKGFLRNGDVTGSSSSDDEVADGEGDEGPPSMFGKLDDAEELCEESPSCRSVAQKIRSHEFIIHKKTIELWSLKVERSKKKGNSTLRSDGTLDSVKSMIARVNSSVESIMKEKAKFALYSYGLKWKVGRGKNTLQNSFPGSLLSEEDPSKIFQSIGDTPDQSSSRSCCNLAHNELCKEIKLLSQEKEDLDIKTILLEETYSIILTGLMSRLRVEYFDCNIDTQIRDDIYRNILKEMIKEWRDNIETLNTRRFFMEQKNILREMIREWSNNIETNDTDRLFIEETYHHILNEAVKDIVSYARNMSARNSQDEELSFHDGLLRSSLVRRIEGLVHEPNAFPNHFRRRDGLELDLNPVLLEPNNQLDLDQGELEESAEKDDAFSSVNAGCGMVYQKLNSNNIQLNEVESSIALPPDDEDVQHDQVTSIADPIEYAKYSRCLSTWHEEIQLNKFLRTIMPLSEFSKKINEFEVIACDRISENMSRYYFLLRFQSSHVRGLYY